jgi:hypothetical protein
MVRCLRKERGANLIFPKHPGEKIAEKFGFIETKMVQSLMRLDL